MNKKAALNFSLSGFIIGLVFFSMFATGFGLLITDLHEKYNINADNSLAKYEAFDRLQTTVDSLNEKKDVDPPDSLIDIIGGFFSSGYEALKTAFDSLSLFSSMTNDMSEDIPALSKFKIFDYLTQIILISVILGVGVAALLKWGI